MLRLQITTDFHEREAAAGSNFVQSLGWTDSELAQQITKDPYIFDFLALDGQVQARALRLAPASMSLSWMSGYVALSTRAPSAFSFAPTRTTPSSGTHSQVARLRLPSLATISYRPPRKPHCPQRTNSPVPLTNPETDEP